MAALAYNYAQYFCHSVRDGNLKSQWSRAQAIDALPTVNFFSILKVAHLFKSAHCYNLRRHLARPLRKRWALVWAWQWLRSIIGQASKGCVELKCLPGNPIDH